nr:uncharacterized protein LOC111415147 [Onthophagus taurus]
MQIKTPLLTLVIIAIFIGQSIQNVQNNKIDFENIQELTNKLLSSKNIDKLGGMVSKLLEKAGTENVDDMMNKMAKEDTSGATAQLLQVFGNLIKAKLTETDKPRGETEDKKGGLADITGLDASMLGNVLSLVGNFVASNKGGKEGDFDPSTLINVVSSFTGGKLGGVDVSTIINMFSMFAPKDDDENEIEQNTIDAPPKSDSRKIKPKKSFTESLVDVFSSNGPEIFQNLPDLMDNIKAFFGIEAQAREEAHKDHKSFLPPVLEKLHVFFDHFMHSPFGKNLWVKFEGDKYMKLFSDEQTGNFSYSKFVEMVENHSFRKHWLTMVTKKVSELLSYFADPYRQQNFVVTIQFFVNNFLQQRGVPKAALFDPSKPTETLSALVNYISKHYFGQKVDAKAYVAPAVTYVKEVLAMAEAKGIVGHPIDSDKLTHKLADTINLDIIEPIMRVNRAYRFATKVPQCDRYVMCLVNKELPDDDPQLPGLKQALSKGASLLSSWFLSAKTGTSFWSFYHVILEENNCEARYLDDCHGFHVEEIKVTTEYVHNEL